MKTVRDHIASRSDMPASPPGATHVLVWEPYGSNRSQWALGALDAPAPDDEAAILDGAADAHPGELLERVVAVLGYPVRLSARIECEGEYAHYVTPAWGGR